MYELAIIGGGPGGVSAGVYASRKQLKTIFITKEFGGQSNVSEDIQNWIGTPHVHGLEFAKMLENHLKEYAKGIVDIRLGDTIKKVEKTGDHFSLTTDDGTTYEAKTVLLCMGSTRRKLTVPGAEKFDNNGITYCASCDGPLYAGQDVVVIGGGNAGFETTAQLSAYCKSVTLIQRAAEYRADPITVEKVLSKPNVKGITDTEIVEIKGDTTVTTLVYLDKKTNQKVELPVSGVFVEIGLVPSTDFVKDLVKLNAGGQIEIDPWTQMTSTPGVWAAGDCTNVKYHQNNIASGDAVRALEDIYLHIHTK